MRAFLSHASADAGTALELAKHLLRCLDSVFYFEEYERSSREGFQTAIAEELERCDVLVVLVGRKLASARTAMDSYQIDEAQTFDRINRSRRERRGRVFFVHLRDEAGSPFELPVALNTMSGFPRYDLPEQGEDVFGSRTRVVAARIIACLDRPWRSSDDLPLEPHLFSSEKEIADFFEYKADAGDELYLAPGDAEIHAEMRRKILKGCPSTWPTVQKMPGEIENPINQEILGHYRDPDAEVVVNAQFRKGHNPGLRVPEAGPRKRLRFGRDTDGLKAAILVSGGIAPGTNAVIDGIVQRHRLYAHEGNYRVSVVGIEHGFRGFQPFTSRLLDPNETSRFASTSGSLLPTSRVEALLGDKRHEKLEDIARQLANHEEIDILYVIGGDGSMRAAHALWSIAEELFSKQFLKRRLSVVGVPKTMDNDILWMWQSFGFLSAVEKAREIVQDLSTEVTSNPRACVVQLFGSDSGFVVSHAVLASSVGTCDAALIPEVPFCTHGLADHLIHAIYNRDHPHLRVETRSQRIPSTMVVMAETAIPVDAEDYLHDSNVELRTKERKALEWFDSQRAEGRRIQGRTPDELRDAGMKIVVRGIGKHVSQRHHVYAENANRALPPVDWSSLRLFTSEPRHLLRTIAPNTVDLISAQRLGLLAVDNALAGYTDFMISQWLTEYVLVPLKLVTLGRKRIPEGGMFWKSVLAKTRQPSRMICRDCVNRFQLGSGQRQG